MVDGTTVGAVTVGDALARSGSVLSLSPVRPQPATTRTAAATDTDTDIVGTALSMLIRRRSLPSVPLTRVSPG